MKEQMIAYLQQMVDAFLKAREMYGPTDRDVNKKFDAMIACKEMAEALIGEPINLQMDGMVTVGGV